MNTVIAAMTLLSTGCLVLPETKETTTVTTTSSTLTVDAVGPSELTASASGGVLAGIADWHRECWRAIDAVHQTTRKRESTIAIEGTASGLGDVVGLLLAAPLTGAVSGIVSAIIVEASHPNTTRSLSHDTILIPCSVVAAREPAGLVTVSAIGTTLAVQLAR